MRARSATAMVAAGLILLAGCGRVDGTSHAANSGTGGSPTSADAAMTESSGSADAAMTESSSDSSGPSGPSTAASAVTTVTRVTTVTAGASTPATTSPSTPATTSPSTPATTSPSTSAATTASSTPDTAASTTPATTPATTAPTTQTTGDATTDELRAAFADAMPVDPGGYAGLVTPVGFQSPSGNITCGFVDAPPAHSGPPIGVVCQISRFSFDPPIDCHGAGDGGAVTLGKSGEPHFRCAGDVESGGPSLAYGSQIRADGVQCVSRTSGVTCVNDDGDGFTLARAGYRFIGD